MNEVMNRKHIKIDVILQLWFPSINRSASNVLDV